jgi:hypothetical protein
MAVTRAWLGVPQASVAAMLAAMNGALRNDRGFQAGIVGFLHGAVCFLPAPQRYDRAG